MTIVAVAAGSSGTDAEASLLPEAAVLVVACRGHRSRSAPVAPLLRVRQSAFGEIGGRAEVAWMLVTVIRAVSGRE